MRTLAQERQLNSTRNQTPLAAGVGDEKLLDDERSCAIYLLPLWIESMDEAAMNCARLRSS
jgi:hypothetical protein